MLPVLRTVMLGGVLLVLFGFAAGLAVTGGFRSHASRLETPGRGALLRQEDHPEWRQFLVQANAQRGFELMRLADLPRTPMIVIEGLDRTDEPYLEMAALPASPDTDEPDENKAIPDSPEVELGAASSSELPIVTPPEITPPSAQPKITIPARDYRRKLPRRTRFAAKPAPEPPSNPLAILFSALFGGGKATGAANVPTETAASSIR